MRRDTAGVTAIFRGIWGAAGAAAALLLAACGGSSSENTPLDVSGIWAAAASGSNPQSFVYALDGVIYGYQIESGTTIRYFKGATYSTSGNDFSYTNSRYDEGSVGSIVTTSAGLTGSVLGSYAPATGQATLSFSAGSATPTFKTMTATFDAVGTQSYDLRDFAGTFTTNLGTGNSVVLTASSATSGTLQGTGINGCDFSGAITLTRSDRNVWTVALTQSNCTATARNGLTSNGLATLGKSGSTLLLYALSLDGQAWNRIETQR